MKREIKFRAKTLSRVHVWVYGGAVLQINGRAFLFENTDSLVSVEEDFDEESSAYIVEGLIEVDPETIGQYTGLKGCKGREIYEGDIIRVSEYENILTREFNDDPNRFDVFTLDEIKGDLQQLYTSPVVWEEGTFCISTNGDWLHHNDMFLAVLFGDMKRSNPIFDIKVVGNIYDNPELMKGEK